MDPCHHQIDSTRTTRLALCMGHEVVYHNKHQLLGLLASGREVCVGWLLLLGWLGSPLMKPAGGEASNVSVPPWWSVVGRLERLHRRIWKSGNPVMTKIENLKIDQNLPINLSWRHVCTCGVGIHLHHSSWPVATLDGFAAN